MSTNYQELIDDAVMGCCDTFGAGAGEDAVTYALTEAREASTGWVDFLGKLYRSVLDRLSVVPKAEIDTAGILKAVGEWFDRIVAPMKFKWGDAAIKSIMRKGLLAVVELAISTLTGT